MTDISYFQTYSQRENHVTNNTLLMLRHVHRRSPARLEKLLRSVVDNEEVEIGPRFAQQIRESHSVPDAVLEQTALHVYVEAKYGDALRDDQLVAHVNSIASRNYPKGSAYLIGLSPEPVSVLENTEASAAKVGVQFRSTTYPELLSNLKEACKGDFELEEILEDYRSFLAAEGLLPDQERHMVAFLCGTSWRDNVATGVYYEPEGRNPKWARARVVGVYKDKCITHIGRIHCVAICRLTESGLQIVRTEFGKLHDSDQSRIEMAIEAGRAYFGDFAANPHRFYVVDKFVETHFEKASAGGMLGHRYFDLEELLSSKVDDATPISEIAEELNKQSFS